MSNMIELARIEEGESITLGELQSLFFQNKLRLRDKLGIKTNNDGSSTLVAVKMYIGK